MEICWFVSRKEKKNFGFSSNDSKMIEDHMVDGQNYGRYSRADWLTCWVPLFDFYFRFNLSANFFSKVKLLIDVTELFQRSRRRNRSEWNRFGREKFFYFVRNLYSLLELLCSWFESTSSINFKMRSIVINNQWNRVGHWSKIKSINFHYDIWFRFSIPIVPNWWWWIKQSNYFHID